MIEKIENFVNRLIIFFDLWGDYHYDNRIGALLAWELAGIFNDNRVLDEYEPLKP